MVTTAHRDDVVALSVGMLEVYRPGRVFYDVLQTDESEQSLSVAIHGQSRDLRDMLVVFEAVQLAFDAAAVAVLYRENPESPGDRDQESALRELATQPSWMLEITELSSGSFSAKAIFRGTRTALKVAALAALLLTPLIGPVPFAVLEGAELMESLAEEAFEALRQRRQRREDPQPEAGPSPALGVPGPGATSRVQWRQRQNAARAQLENDVQSMVTQAVGIGLRSIDTEALREQGASIRIEVQVTVVAA